MRWEYKTISLSSYSDGSAENEFNNLGREGWELIAVTGPVAIFKRPAS